MIMNYNCFGLRVCCSFVVLLLVVGQKSGTAQRVLDNVFCNTRPAVVPVDATFQMFPFYVELHRCGGSASYVSPLTLYCAANTTEDVQVKVSVFDHFGRSTNDVVTMKNHTSCVHKCVNTKSMCDPEYQLWQPDNCDCECKYPTGPPEGCPDNFRWDPTLCQCVCDAVPNGQECLRQERVWNDDMCRCTCSKRVINRCRRKNKDLDETTCQCVDRPLAVGARQGEADCVSKVLLFGVMLGELIVVLLLVDICLYMKGLGVIHHFLKKKSSHRTTDKSQDAANGKLTHETTTYI